MLYIILLKEAHDDINALLNADEYHLKHFMEYDIYSKQDKKVLFNEYLNRDNILKDISISIIEPYLTRQGSVKNYSDYINRMSELKQCNTNDYRVSTRIYVSQRVYEYDIQNDTFKTFEIFGNDEESYHREDSDYLPEAGTKFKIGEEVKVKGFRNESIFIIESIPRFDIPHWENTYSIYLKGDESNWYEDIHEGDLIKSK